MNDSTRALAVEYLRSRAWGDVERLLTHLDEDIRATAAAVCAGFASQEGLDLAPLVTALTAALDDADEVAKEAAYALTWQHTRTGAWEAVSALLAHGKALVRQVAGFALGNAAQDALRIAPAVPALRRNLDDASKSVFYCAARALVFHHASADDAPGLRALLADPRQAVSGAARNVVGNALCSLAAAGNAAAVSTWLVLGAPADSQDDDGTPALVLAGKNGRDEVLTALAERGASLDAPDAGGRTALMHAAYQGREGAARRLLERGADMNLVSPAEFTALDYAAKGLELPIASLLHARGAKMGDPGSVMSFVCDEGHVELAKIVLAHAPPLDALDENGFSALHYASMKGHAELAALLLEKGAGVNVPSSDGRTALAFAELNGHGELVEVLKQHGATAP